MARKYKRIEEDVAKGTVEQTITEDTVSRYGPKMTKKRLLNIFQKRYDEAMDKVDEVEAAGIPMEATVRHRRLAQEPRRGVRPPRVHDVHLRRQGRQEQEEDRPV